MKKSVQFLFSLVALMCIALTANAQIADGKYYLQNVESGKYWGAGNDWGTRASLVKNPEYVTLISNEDGTYNLESQVSNGGTNYYFGGDYMDGAPVAGGLTITASGDYYTIANGDNYYGYDGSSTVLGKNLAADSKNALWNIISEADMVASLAKATADAPVDATFLILAQGFGRNNRNGGGANNDLGSKWIVSEDCTNKNLSGGNNTNNCAESYHSVFTISQTIANAPKGVYKLTAQGFYRQDGEDNDNLPYIFINDEKGGTFPLKTGSENNMSAASASFSNGLYPIDAAFIELAEDGELVVGTKLETNTTLWCIWDNFELTYYGADANLSEIMFADLIAQVEALRTQAEELQGKSISPVTKTAIEDALAASTDIEATKEAYNAVIAALSAANNKAEADIKNWAAIEALSTLTDNTNVYTAEAFEAYEKIRGDYKTAWEEGTLTETVVNPEVVAGWHSANTFDDLLLSAWSIGVDKCQDFNTALYINTWSVEGENDGTQFKVPFFEYWTGDANSLNANNLTAIVEGVTPGDYVVKAWVRVRAKNGVDAAEATGITLEAGGDPVDVTEGEKVGTSQFNIGEYKANATVGEDGKLIISFIIADDNNISWLSFKNVKYITPEESAAEELQKNYEKALPTITAGNYYEIFAEVGEDTYYLTSEGKLTADEAEAKAFEFKAENASGTQYATGWNINKFTNPSLSNGSTGDITNDGALHMNNADRNSWERQVFFLEGDKYAVRSTNATGTNWGANTYWTVVTDNELPEAGYSLTPIYTWQLKDVTAQAALAAAKAVIEAKEGVGTDLFQIPEDAYNTYAAAVEAADAAINAEDATAESIAAAVAALKAAGEAYATAPRVAPKAGKPYAFALTTSDGTYALSISSEGIKIADEETETYIVAQEDGTFAIANSDGEYVNYAGGNNWTMAASADAYGWIISAAEGGYTIQGKNGLLGTNTSDGAAAGSPCYGDKKTTNGYVVWAITEIKPVFDETPLTKDMFKGWDGFDASASVNNETPYWDAVELGTSGGGGTTIFGSGNVTNTDYADVTGADVLRFEGDPGLPLRLLINRQADNTLVEINPVIGAEGYVDVDLTPYEYVHINAVKINWGAEGAVTAMTLNPGFFKYEWSYDFEADKEGVAIVGAGTIVDDENAKFGKVFENVGGAVRTNYFTLPEDVLAHSTESKQLTIGFWVNAEGTTMANPYAPFFTAYASNTNGADNGMPMLALQSRGLAQVNCNGWTDFTGADNVDGKDNVYNKNAWEANDAAFNFVENWLDDSDWHYYTAVFTEEGLTIYFDGEVKNQWTCDGTEGHTLAGLFSNGADLKHICLGGNQAWNWGDGDAPFRFDDVFVTNYALDQDDITDIMAAKLYGVSSMYTYNVERIAGLGYTAENVAYDEADILADLGVESWDAIEMYPIVMTTGEAGEDHDGWRDINGDPAEWNGDGTDLGLCLKYPHDGGMALCTHPGNDPKAGEVLSAGWLLSAGDKKTAIITNVTFVEPEPIEIVISENVIKASIEYASTEASYVEKVVTLTDEDVQAILTELGIASLDEADIYGYNPTTKELLSSYAGYDGWRNADGDFANWSGNSTVPACVKYTDGKNYYCYNISGCDAQDIKTYWAIATEEKAVLVEITFTYTVPVGIANIENAAAKANGKYLENGKVVIIKNGVKYNVAGQVTK
ncbi:MAG: hypothetical protein IJ693_02895 [Bacteroidaceae bacterium]|nr:hypothetical protein [Bacteroidaceae bacterium]